MHKKLSHHHHSQNEKPKVVIASHRNWEDSHHHLGKKQQENIDLLEHQTQKFEEISTRIQNALKQTEDPKIFESRLNFITKQTKYLEEKLDDVQQSMADKAVSLEKSVKCALNKYKEMENVSDLISIGVSPHNVLGIDGEMHNDDDGKEKEQQRQRELDEDEKKLSFLYKMDESETGFNYERKKMEIKNIISDVLDCKHKIDKTEQQQHDARALKMRMDKLNYSCEQSKYEELDIEDDDQFMNRIRKRIQKTMSMIHEYTPKNPPSLSVVKCLLCII